MTYPNLDDINNNNNPSTSTSTSTPLEQGLGVRRQVLGTEYVNRAWGKASPFTRPGQQLITEYAWANVWQREGLDWKQRSLLTIGIIIAQKAWLELVLHTRGAINNGVSELEIREAVIHAMVYCGTPAGVEAMMVTEKTILEMIANGEYTRPEGEGVEGEGSS